MSELQRNTCQSSELYGEGCLVDVINEDQSVAVRPHMQQRLIDHSGKLFRAARLPFSPRVHQGALGAHHIVAGSPDFLTQVAFGRY